MNEFSFSDLIMLNHLFKKFQLVIVSIAMIASTSLPLGVLQIGVWANMFEQFYEETRSVFLSAEWTFDGDHRCSGCQLVSDLGAKTKESLKSSSLSIENQLSVPVASKFQIARPHQLGSLFILKESYTDNFLSVEKPPPKV